MQLDDRLGKWQTKTGALAPGVERRIHAVERLDHQRYVLGPDADPSVPDMNAQCGTLDVARDRDTPPTGVNFIALPIKLTNTCFSLTGSPSSIGQLDGSPSTTISTFAAAAVDPGITRLSAKSVPGCVETRSICSLPASTLERSSIS